MVGVLLAAELTLLYGLYSLVDVRAAAVVAF